jgi:hypothetical protein
VRQSSLAFKIGIHLVAKREDFVPLLFRIGLGDARRFRDAPDRHLWMERGLTGIDRPGNGAALLASGVHPHAGDGLRPVRRRGAGRRRTAWVQALRDGRTDIEFYDSVRFESPWVAVVPFQLARDRANSKDPHSNPNSGS